MMFRRLIYIFMASACLTTFMACHDYDGVEVPDNVNSCYINLSVAVVNSDERMTRAEPLGGENGDGREAGFERENSISGITLILYRTSDGKGINTTTNPTIELVRYFPVSLVSRQTAGTAGTGRYVESVYTTGNQLLGRDNNSKLSGKYHALVIANNNLTANFKEGTTTLNTVRDFTHTYINDAESPLTEPHKISNFVMTSEQDYSFDIGETTQVTTTTDEARDKYFELKSPILIERMAARIDFCAANSTGYEGAAYDQKGYVYNVQTAANAPTADRFVVSGFRTFNCYRNYTPFQEYLFKRVGNATSEGVVSNIVYLGDESAENYVIDPNSKKKNYTSSYSTQSDAKLLEESFYYLYVTRMTTSTGAMSMTESGYRSVAAMHQAIADGATAGFEKLPGTNDEDVIIDYVQENTLLPNAMPYFHATGIALIGYYYKNGTGPGERRVYCGYLRHQGDADSYDLSPLDASTFSSDKTISELTSIPMNYGVVRNNIYRLSIDKVIQAPGSAPKIKMKIKVKKWDKFVHDPLKP